MPGHGRRVLRAYMLPVLGEMAIASVDVAAVMQVLAPMWKGMPETGSRVRARIESVLDFAASRGWRTAENPARWRGHLANLLPAPGRIAERPALCSDAICRGPGFHT